MAAKPLSPAHLARIRAGLQRNPGSPAARTIRVLLDEIDRLANVQAASGPRDRPRNPPPVAPRQAYYDCAAMLRKRPGDWGAVAVYETSGSARQAAYRIRTGQFKPFRPVGAYDAKAFTEDGIHRVRARYMPTTRSDEKGATA